MITVEEGQKLINQLNQIQCIGGLNVSGACLVLATEIQNLVEPAPSQSEDTPAPIREIPEPPDSDGRH